MVLWRRNFSLALTAILSVQVTAFVGFPDFKRGLSPCRSFYL